MRSIILSACAVYASYGGCMGGTCPDNQRESSVLMQRLNRKKRQLPLRQAAQAAPASHPTAELFQVVAQMLRNGTTSDAYEFANDTLEQLEVVIIPALIDGYTADQEILNSTMHHFDTAMAAFEGHRAQLEEHHSAVQQARADHETCRSQDVHDCDLAAQCEMERERLWTIYTSKEDEYLTVVTTIKHYWCEADGNRSAPVWRESMTRKFNHFITEGQERITAWEAHESWKQTCVEKNYTLGEHQELCGEKQRALEAASCTRLTTYNTLMENLHTSWAVATQQYHDVVPAIREREEIRHAEFKNLKGIKCLLKWIVHRALEPCREDEEPGVYEHMLTECETYWQIDVDMILSPWNLTYPELPPFPAAPELEPYPCTEAYNAEEYGHLSGSCVPLLQCQPCAESPYQPPASNGAVSSHQQETDHAQSPEVETNSRMSAGPPENVEEYQTHAHTRINGDVLQIMSAVADANECAEACNILKECKAFRYFTDPERICELLSHYQVDDKVHDTYTFTFVKEAPDGAEVQDVIEEVVFHSFDDQPEIEKITFALVDTNDDGFLNTAEFVDLCKRMEEVFFGGHRLPDDHWKTIAGRTISELDNNQDGLADRDEVVAGEELVAAFVESFEAYGTYLASMESGDADNQAGLEGLQFFGLEASQDHSNTAPSLTPAHEGTV